MRYVLAIALILAAAVGLAWYRTSTMQADLVEAVEAALVAADAEEVLVSVDGMEVTLAGQVADSATKERIDRAVARLPKVGRFVNAVEVAPATGQGEAVGPGRQVAVPRVDATANAVGADGALLEIDYPPVVEDPAVDAATNAALGSVGGCQAGIDETLGRGTIDFESSSAELEPASLPLLDSLVAALLGCGEEGVEIAGHTDASGPREDNLELSLRRAEAVKAYLVAGNVPASRLTAVGYGPDVPLVDNATPEGRAMNRRIELKVLSP